MTAPPSVGSTIAGYRLQRLLGRGSMGVVYLAEQTRLRRLIALKVMAPELAADPSFVERFIREAELAAAVDHPSIVPIHDAGESDGLLYLAMRYVDGIDLAGLLREEGPLSLERALGLLDQVAGALDAAHARGIVHRDVKPLNILLERSPEGAERAYLTDFGLTKRIDVESGLTHTGMFLGTFAYAAPEQLEGGHLDARTDVYAIGCVLYECLTGKLPFPRDSEPLVAVAHLTEPPPRLTASRPDLPISLDSVIATAMAKDPRERYASASRVMGAAREAGGGSPSPVRTPPPPTRVVPSVRRTAAAPPPRPPRRRRVPVVLGTAAVVGLLGVVALVLLMAPFGDGSGTRGTPASEPPTSQGVELGLTGTITRVYAESGPSIPGITAASVGGCEDLVGLQIVVSDDEANRVGEATAGAAEHGDVEGATELRACTVRFALALPRLPLYQIMVGRQAETMSLQQLRADDYRITIVLRNPGRPPFEPGDITDARSAAIRSGFLPGVSQDTIEWVQFELGGAGCASGRIARVSVVTETTRGLVLLCERGDTWEPSGAIA